MSSRAREVELILLAMYAALPLYANESVSAVPLALFHSVLALAAFLVIRRRNIEPPRGLLRALTIAYLVFLPIDAVVISRSLITASGHLVLFIAAYQVFDPVASRRLGQRIVVILLMFVTSVATSTSLLIVFFVIGFAFLGFRQLIRLSYDVSAADVGLSLHEREVVMSPARYYLLPTLLAAVAIFPALPRLHNPLVRGVTGAIEGASTGLSDTIDFSVTRSISSDPTVIARVWMPPDVVPFFTPLRLRGAMYDAWRDGRWKASKNRYMSLVADSDGIEIAEPVGFSREVTIQQNVGRDRRLFLPVGTHAIRGLPQVLEGPRPTVFMLPWGTSGSVSYRAVVSRSTRPLGFTVPPELGYPVRPEIRRLAEQVVGNERQPEAAARKIETWMATSFEYVADPAELGGPVSVDAFLLEIRRGHCEYFAAGMVVLLDAIGIRSRIIGGFYGGKLNPLTGYFTVARSDAHAWVEVYNGAMWVTFDPTPPALRPGNQQQGLVRAYASAVADSVNYFWDRYVLTYGLSDQIALLMKAVERGADALAAIRTAGRALSLRLIRLSTLYAIVLSVLLVASVFRFIRSRRPAYSQLLEALERRGFAIDDSVAPLELLERVRRTRPEIAADAAEIVDAYVRERFSAASRVSAETRAAVRLALRRVLKAL